MLDPVRAVQIPGEGSAALATARFMVRQILASARIVSLLHFVSDQTILDKNSPRTAAGTVHTVCGAHDLVMRPTTAISRFPLAILVSDDAVAIGERLFVLAAYKILQSIEKVTHVFFCSCIKILFKLSGSGGFVLKPVTSHHFAG
jgi:hypothetical protein